MEIRPGTLPALKRRSYRDRCEKIQMHEASEGQKLRFLCAPGMGVVSYKRDDCDCRIRGPHRLSDQGV